MANNIQLITDVTEYACTPEKKNERNVFYFYDKSLVISFCESDENEVISQSEIEREDAIKLAKTILFYYGIQPANH